MDNLDNFRNASSIIAATIAVVISVIILFKAKQVQFGSLSIDLDKTKDKQADADTSYEFGEIDRTLSNNERQFLLLKQYHSQGLAQSRISFWFSLIFAALGFIVIVISILTVDQTKSFWSQPSSIISLISGTIIDAVSALFFVQSSKSRELMSTFFDKLRTDRKIEESLKLADGITDELLKSKLKMILSLHFAEIVTSESIVSIIFKELQKPIDTTPE